VILAASCEYLRGLWAGSFSEALGAAEVDVDAEADASVVSMLIQIVYGAEVILRSLEELLRLHCLADKWQCKCVVSETLAAIKKKMSRTEAEGILGQQALLPTALMQLAAVPVLAELSQTWETVVWTGSGRSRKSVSQRRPAKVMTLTAFARLLSTTSEHAKLLEIERSELLQRIVLTTDAFVDSPEWLQLPATIISEVMQLARCRGSLVTHVARWAQHCADAPGTAVLRIMQLYKAKAVFHNLWHAAFSMLRLEQNVVSTILYVTVANETFSDLEEPAPKRRKRLEEGWAIELSALEPESKEWLAKLAAEYAAECFATMSPSVFFFGFATVHDCDCRR